MTTPSADLYLDAGVNVNLNGTATVARAFFNAQNNLQLNGSLTAQFTQLYAGHVLNLNGTVNTGTLYGFGSTINLAGTVSATYLNLQSSGALNLGTSAKVSGTDTYLQAAGLATIQFAAANGQGGFNFTNGNSFYLSAGGFTPTSDMVVPGGVEANLVIGSGGINAAAYKIQGVDNVVVNGGNLAVDDLHVKTVTVTGGNLTGREVGATNLTVSGALALTGKLETVATDLPGVLHTYSAGSISAAGNNPRGAMLGLIYDGKNAGAAGGLVELHADTLLFDTSGVAINGASLNGNGGDGGSLSLGTDALPIPGAITLSTAISATTNGNKVGTGGSVSAVSDDTVTVNSTIKVSDSVTKPSAAGGHITIKSNRTGGTAINVTSSAQLLSLLSSTAAGPGGTIKFTSAGGAINMSGTARADRGSVELTNNGASGVVTLSNATLAAGTVKAGALGNNGTLNVGGGTISADSAIKLYAGGSNGSVNFTDNVTLSGNSVKTIAGDSVTIFNGKIVTVNGPAPAEVFTNHANYSGFGGNGSTTGTFGGQGANTHTLTGAPGY